MAQSCSGMNLEFKNPQNLGSLLMKSSQSNFHLRSPGSYSVHSYLITAVPKTHVKNDTLLSIKEDFKELN